MNKEPIKCESCGKFIAYDKLNPKDSYFHFIPLNEFGPEELYWIGPCCRKK